MPRIRAIKPQFWLDEKLGAIQRDARLLYIGLWNLSDDQGVFEWRPARIKVQLFPYDNDVNDSIIEQWLALLIGSGDILKFNCNGSVFGFIPTFLKHQDIKKPSQWKFANIPLELLTNHPLVYNQSHIDGGEVGDELPISSTREKEKESIIGNREKEKESIVSAAFERVSEEIKLDFADIDFDEEFKKCVLWWSEGRKPLKKPKLALRNWMVNARKYKKEYGNGTYQGHDKQNGDTRRNHSQGSKSKDYTGGKYGRFVQS